VVLEDVDEQAATLGEIGCGTVGGYPYNGGVADNNGSTQTAPNLPFCSFAFSSAVSPTATYGSASCPGQYVFELTNATNRTLNLWPQWAGPPLNWSVACTSAKMEFGMYKRQGGSWTLHATTKMHGNWMGSFCQFGFDTGYSSLVLNTRTGSPDSAVTDMRVTARATAGSPPVPQRARVDILNIREVPPNCQ
jgi:hypothetical protein